jgi:flagellar biosynthesis protein FlhG
MNSQAESLINLLKKKDVDFHKPPNIFAFTSGKGGTGKTFVSLNLACLLSQLNRKVLFIDFDSNLSNADVLLNHSSEGTIIEFFLNQKKFVNVITRVDETFHCVFGDSGLSNFPKLTDNLINQFLQNVGSVSSEYDFIFIDTGAGLNSEIIKMLHEVSNIVLVINPEPTTIIDAYAVLKMTAESEAKKFVIVNSVFSSEEAEDTFSNLLKASLHFLKIKISNLGFINFDKEIRRSIIEQKIFVNHFRNSSAFLQFKSVASKLQDMIQLANISQSAI